MTPLERSLPLKDIAKIRVECGSCQTAISFTTYGQQGHNVGDECPFCLDGWGAVAHVVLQLQRVLEDATHIKSHTVSVVERTTTPY